MEKQLIELGVHRYKVFKNDTDRFYPTDKLIFDPYKNNIQRKFSENDWIESLRGNNTIQDYLLYQLFYQLMLCNPDKLINKNSCMIYPKIKSFDNIIVYGKGVFANCLIKRINELHYCNIIDNIDKLDIDRIRSINANSYNFIVIAILNSEIVLSSFALLTEIIKDKDKILFIEKENLSIDLLPIEVREMWMEANFDR